MELVRHMLKNMELKKYTMGVFLDLSLTLEQEMLLEKLEMYGIRGKAYEWFDSYLSNRPLRLKCNISSTGETEYSDTFQSDYGTHQGSCLGPFFS